jgi:hypothetical protein
MNCTSVLRSRSLHCRILLQTIVPVSVMATLVAAGPTSETRSSAGAGRSWEGSMPVSPYSTVNLYDGNVLTVVPTFTWSGAGAGRKEAPQTGLEAAESAQGAAEAYSVKEGLNGVTC